MNKSTLNQGNILKAKPNIPFYLTLVVMLILFIVAITLLYTTGKHAANKGNSFKSGDTFIIVISCLTIAFIVGVYFYFPDIAKNIWLALTGSSYLVLLIFYIFFIIILYENILTVDQVKESSFVVLPITVLIGILLFYMNFNESVSSAKLFQGATRIKFTILYFCLILFLTSLYVINPNNYITQYLGPYLVTSILLCVFGFLYLSTLMTFPSRSPGASLISSFQTTSILSVVLFLLFVIIGTVGIVSFPGGFSNSDSSTRTGIIILFSLICIVWIISFGLSLFNGDNTSGETGILSGYAGIFRNVLLIVFGLTFSGLLLYWIISFMNSLSQTSSLVSFLLNLVIILAVLGLTFKILTNTTFYENSPLTRLVVNTILYIPCIFVVLVDRLSHLSGLTKTYTNMSFPGFQQPSFSKENTSTYYVYLAIIVAAFVIYLLYPYIEEKRTSQGGMLLVNQPVYLNQLKNLASYHTLNNISTVDVSNPINPMQFNYNYAISFWVFLDSSNQSKANQYSSILNYGNKPNVLFSPMDNILLFTIDKTSSSDINNLTMDEEQGTQVLYEHKNVLLQKWNHIVLQYNGGTFDIFINGKLVKSVIGVVPYKTMDILQIGTENGIQGGICNVNYFNKLVNLRQIQNLYNFFKDKTPPSHSSSQDTIINVIEQIPNVITNKPIQIANVTGYTDELNNKLDDVTSKLGKYDADIIPENEYSSNFLSWDWYFKNNKY